LAIEPFPEGRVAESLELVEPDGRVRAGGDALNALAERLPGVGWAVRLPLERTYRLVARNRHRLARLVPDRPLTKRS
jgi:hypothetical protein